MKSFQKIILPAIAVILIAAACNPTPAPATPSASPTAVMTPTITLEPMAVSINGVGVTLAEYQQELLRLQDAQSQLGITSNAEEQKQKVLADLTDQLPAGAGSDPGWVHGRDDSSCRDRIEQS